MKQAECQELLITTLDAFAQQGIGGVETDQLEAAMVEKLATRQEYAGNFIKRSLQRAWDVHQVKTPGFVAQTAHTLRKDNQVEIIIDHRSSSVIQPIIYRLPRPLTPSPLLDEY